MSKHGQFNSAFYALFLCLGYFYKLRSEYCGYVIILRLSFIRLLIKDVGMIWKNILVVWLSGWLMACGSSSDGDEGQYQELEQYKGVSQEPNLIEVDEQNDSDAVELNSLITGEIDRSHSILFQYTSSKEGDVALVLNSASDNIDFRVRGEGLEQSSIAFTGNDAVVFTAFTGGFYEIRIYSEDNNATPFQFKIVEANRASLGLSDSEYWVNSIVNDRDTCSDNEDLNTYTFGQIFNFEEGYVSYGDGVKIADWNLKDELSFSYIESYSNEVITYSYEYDVELNLEVGTVVGAGIFTSSYLEEDCEGISNYEGKILL